MRDDARSGHDSHPDLLEMLRGQLTNAEVHAADEHLDACPSCRDELRELAIGHALLTHTAATVRPAQPVTSPALPPVPPLRAPHRARPWVRPVALAAAAAVLVAGTAATTARLARPEPTPPVAADLSGRLEPLEGAGAGEVLMSEHGRTVLVTIRTHDLPTASKGEFYYAWLLEPETNKMLPLGQVGPGDPPPSSSRTPWSTGTSPWTCRSRTTTATRATR